MSPLKGELSLKATEWFYTPYGAATLSPPTAKNPEALIFMAGRFVFYPAAARVGNADL